ncbi:L-lysine 2,3-aminomutase [Pseudocercospora fuligena]|uniref:L-lysine 2,3-aminomutase n=1 Tax=Pseudocercospora fuligena TaxID=685502 RepID=A0A8H6RKJ7_9PEZI|nr:L-lysine 2,3-aminomutase [Pseudocercospora fuligena]
MGCNNRLRGSCSRSPTVASLSYVQSRQRSRNFATQAGIVDRVSGSAFITPDLYNPKPNPLATATRPQGPAYWRQIGIWKDVTEEEFLSYRWQASPDTYTSFHVPLLTLGVEQTSNTIDRKDKLLRFLEHVLPEHIPHPRTSAWAEIKTRDDFLADVEAGMKAAPMSVRLTPHMLSVANWNDPLSDPIRRQFIPLGSTITPDHPALTLDSLHETDDSPVPGLVHRYPDKVLFLGKLSSFHAPILYQVIS